MVPTAVLAIGLDPRFADFSAMPQLSPELVRAYIEAEIAHVRELGFEVDARLIAPGETAEAEAVFPAIFDVPRLIHQDQTLMNYAWTIDLIDATG